MELFPIPNTIGAVIALTISAIFLIGILFKANNVIPKLIFIVVMNITLIGFLFNIYFPLLIGIDWRTLSWLVIYSHIGGITLGVTALSLLLIRPQRGGGQRPK